MTTKALTLESELFPLPELVKGWNLTSDSTVSHIVFVSVIRWWLFFLYFINRQIGLLKQFRHSATPAFWSPWPLKISNIWKNIEFLCQGNYVSMRCTWCFKKLTTKYKKVTCPNVCIYLISFSFIHPNKFLFISSIDLNHNSLLFFMILNYIDF